MKQDELLARHCEVLGCLSWLPRKIVSIHGKDNVTEFVLHELMHEKCFNFDKAAYLINNPDFDCLKGVAGVCRQERTSMPDIWQSADQFSSHMLQAPFNQKVRSVMRKSLKKDIEAQKDVLAMLANDLGFENHTFCSWNLKHDNQGFLVFEKSDKEALTSDDHLLSGLSLLSFCPVF